MVLQGGTAVVNVVANGAALASSISGAVTNATQRVGRSMQASGLAMTKFLTVPLAALGTVATKMALDFDTTFTKIDALASGVGEPLKQARQDVLDLAHATGQDPGGLAEALYFTASAGLAVDKVMPTLKASAKLAATGMGTAADNAKLLTTVLHDYEGTGLGAANVTNILTRAIQLGKAEPDEFAQSLGNVIPFAANLGVSFEDVAAAMAQISNSGLEFSRGVTGLRFLMSALNNPTEEAKNVFKDFGFEIADFQKELTTSGGFLRVMQEFADRFDLTTVAGKAAFATITGGARGAAAAAALVGENAASAAELWKKVGVSARDGATVANEALEIMKRRPEFKFQQALTDLKIAAIDLGNILIPILVKDVIPAIKDVVKFFESLSDSTKKTIVRVGIMAAAFGPLLAIFGSIVRLGGSVFGWLTKIGGAAASAATSTTAVGTAAGLTISPLGLATAAVAGFAGAALLAADNSRDFNNEVQTLVDGFHTVPGAIQEATDRIKDFNTARAEALKDPQGRLSVGFAQARGFEGDRATQAAREALKQYREEMTALVNEQHISDASTLGWITTLAKSETLTKNQAKNLVALVGGFDRMGVALSDNDRRLVSNLLKVGDFSGAMKLLRGRLEDLTTPKWQVKVDVDADTTEIDRVRAKLAGMGFRQYAGGDWALNASVLVHTKPNSPWPWEIIDDGLRSIGFQKGSGNGGSNDVAFFMKTIIEVGSDFEHVQARLQTLLPLIKEAVGEGAADQAKAFARDIKGLEKSFDRLKQKALDFRDAIKGAFSDAADLIGTIGDALQKFADDQARFAEEQASFLEGGGVGTPPTPVGPAPDLSALIAAQVAQAKQLADLLKKLQGEGLNVANLSDLAGQGAAGIPIAQALLDNPELIQQLNDAQERIAEITQQTADKMTQAAFGNKLLKMSEALDTLLGKLNHFLDGLQPEKITDKNREFVTALNHLINAVNDAANKLAAEHAAVNKAAADFAAAQVAAPPPATGGGQGGGGGGTHGGQGPGSGGGQGGGGHGSKPALNDVTINIHGVTEPTQVAKVVRDELLRIGRNNGSTGL